MINQLHQPIPRYPESHRWYPDRFFSPSCKSRNATPHHWVSVRLIAFCISQAMIITLYFDRQRHLSSAPKSLKKHLGTPVLTIHDARRKRHYRDIYWRFFDHCVADVIPVLAGTLIISTDQLKQPLEPPQLCYLENFKGTIPWSILEKVTVIGLVTFKVLRLNCLELEK